MDQGTHKETVEAELQIVAELTGVDTSHIDFNDTGWTSRIYLIDEGKLVFKFPRRYEVKEEYQREIAAYKLLNTFDSPVSFPTVRWEHPDLDYFGYEGVVGEILCREAKTLSDDDKKEVGARLGNLLRELHQSTLGDESFITYTYEKENKEHQEKFDQVRDVLMKEFSIEEFQKIQDFVHEKYSHDMQSLGYQPSLCHGDLGCWNVIYKEGRIGIIDFGDVGYYDHAIDFAGMTDKTIFAAALSAYGADIKVRKRAELRMLLIPVMDLLFFIGKNDREGIKNTCQKIRSNLGKL